MRDLGLFVIILIIEASLHKRTTFQQAIMFKRSTIFNQIATVSYSNLRYRNKNGAEGRLI